MNRSIVRLGQLTLMGLTILVFSIFANFPAYAQPTDYCRNLGWIEIDPSQIPDLTGTWSGVQNRNCGAAADWQYSFQVVIYREDGVYKARIAGDETSVSLSGNGIVFNRDLSKGAGKDQYNQSTQTWRGKLFREGSNIRIYGVWSGAFDTLKRSDYNLDFQLIKAAN